MNLEEALNTSAYTLGGVFVRVIESSGFAPAYAEMRFPNLLRAASWVAQWGLQDSAVVVKPAGTPGFNLPVTLSFNLEEFSKSWGAEEY